MSTQEKMKGFSGLTTVSELLWKLFEAFPPPRIVQTENCKSQDALLKVLAKDVISPFDVPSFNRSAVDGYSLRAAETIGASPTNPIEFRLVATITAGEEPQSLAKIGNEESALIFTGAPLPEGADSVVMLEQCSQVDGFVQVRRPVHKMQNVSRKGEDYLQNETIVASGTVLRPWHIAAIASIGKDQVIVQRPTHIGVLSTGSEVVEPGAPLKPGQVPNSTKPMLLSFIKEEACLPVDLGTVGDDLDTIRKAVAKGLENCDIILTTGGSSVGEKDLVQQAISQIDGYRFVVHGLRLRPGRPTGVSLIGDKPIFILSGFPVAAMAAYFAVVKPTIRHLVGTEDQPAPHAKGILKRRVSNETGNKSYVRVRVLQNSKGELEVEPLMLTGSGLLSTLTKANALLIIDEEIEGYDEGDEVEVLLTGNIIHA